MSLPSLPDYLSELQAMRLRGIREALDGDLRQVAAARSMGMDPPHLSYCLRQMTGSGRWPPDPALIDALLGLPVLDEAEVRRRRGLRGAEALSFERAADDDIHARREAAAMSRAEHERHWLAEEQAKYRLPRRGRPLSRMPA